MDWTPAQWVEAAPWLADLLPIPVDATWPRVMTAPHPWAVDSLGADFVAWVEAREGRPLRWWQRLMAYRMLEVDAGGHLVWETVLLTLARQLGKSWLVRELCLWRALHADLFGEPQLVLHTGKDVAICREVQRSARRWAKAQGADFKVREVNGQEEIAFLPDDSRWIIRAKQSCNGISASMAVVDESWKVPRSVVDEDVEPTMVERLDAQLVLVSTAHRKATSLMLARRATASEELSAPETTLIVEWSAPPDADIEDVATWRAASPHWHGRRERMIRERLMAAMSGETDDPDEPDPIEAFRAQWLNLWPQRRQRMVVTNDELLFGPGVWEAAADTEAVAEGRLFVAVEDWFGRGASAAACAETTGGRLIVGGHLFDRWADAFAWVRDITAGGDAHVLVGASMFNDPAVAELAVPASTVGRAQTSTGLAMFRELVAAGRLVHDGSEALAGQVVGARVTTGLGGLRLNGDRTDLLRCAVWTAQAAEKSSRIPDVGVH